LSIHHLKKVQKEVKQTFRGEETRLPNQEKQGKLPTIFHKFKQTLKKVKT